MELNHLPIIDWELGVKLAGNHKALAEEMLEQVAQGLPQDILKINQLYKQNKSKELIQYIHKLHGALCYCGLPRLKRLIAQLETELKNNIIKNLPALLIQLNTEVKLLLEHPSLPSS